MKKRILPLLMTVFVLSCHTKPENKTDSPADTAHRVSATDTTSWASDRHFSWTSELDPKKGLVMKRAAPVPEDSLTAGNVLQMINNTYPDIPVLFSRVSNDTIFVRIVRSGYLTEQMGSSGAQAYLAELTYNLTEIKNINYVNISFKAGDHASPDTYCRTDFVKVKD
jgi:hypothetical protein